MAIADSANAQEQMEALISKSAVEKIPIKGAFHFGSGYTSIEGRRYVFTWYRDKYPDPKSLMRKFHAAGMRVVANLKPCLLDDHPRYEEATSAGTFILGEGRRTRSFAVLGWRGRPYRLHQPCRRRLVAARIA